MIVELMGLLIFVGAALLLFARYQGGKKSLEVDSTELKVSIESLQKEMEKSSAEAIERMGSHVNRFERLMKEAKAGGEDLSYHIREMRALEDRLRKEMAESKALSEELKRERERSQNLRDELQRQAALTSQIINSAPKNENPITNVISMQAITSYEQSSVLPEVAEQPTIEEEAENANDFASMLTESLEKAEERERLSLEPHKETYEPSKEAVELLEREEILDAEIKEENPSEVAKRLLESGVSIEEVMRRTGMGRGALQLLAQMINSGK